ncbi:MAG TPA: VWA domain-containing protein [Pyrinomonadaceae bacterium]|nr:VWA domain-containing protein [Pyrinomonadaceae bacterium]
MLRIAPKYLLTFSVCCCLTVVALAQGQQPTPENVPPAQEDEVIQITSELIQTGVMVFDKQGRFVDKLKVEDFELRVDGKPVPVSFFERITAETVAAATAETRRTGAAPTADAPTRAPSALWRGRTIIFFVDDFHLSFEGHKRTRDLINNFVEREMETDDLAAIVSTSGKVGFLQQFTNDKMVLRAAIERLKFSRDTTATDRRQPPMSEYEAQLIDRYDREVTAVFANILLREKLASNQEDAETQVRSRARTILAHAALVSRNTFATLEQAVRRSAQLPGRKIVFFISDGFLLDLLNTDASTRLQRITDAAARSNAVVYSLDPKGLDSGLPDGTTATSNAAFRVRSGEGWEMHEPLSSLAETTGGRFVRNTNDLKTGLTKSLAEASAYYLLAWQPVASEGNASEKFRRIEVSVKGRPELKVSVQGGYLDERPKATSAPVQTAQTSASVPENELRAAANALLPQRSLPTSLVLNYLDEAKGGALLAAALQIRSDAVEFTRTNDKATASLDLVGNIYNSEGKREGYFRERLDVNLPAADLDKGARQDIYYNYQARLKPGLYQMRVAARDAKSGRTGSATQWITIPDLSSRRLALSSLLIGEWTGEAESKAVLDKVAASAAAADDALAGARLSVDRRFPRTSRLRYVVFIYNASRGRAQSVSPDITLQTQVLRGREVVLASPPRTVSLAGQDPTRLPYAAEIPLSGLPPGRYVLEVTVADRNAKANAAQRVGFEVY